MSSYLPNSPLQTFFETVTNSEGTTVSIPLDNGRVHTYINGTTNNVPSYKDAELTIPNQNPIKLDSNGQASIFLDSQIVYTFVIKDKDGNTIETINDIAPNVSVLSAASSLTTDLDVTASALISTANNDINFQPNGTGALTVTTSDGVYEQRVSDDDDVPTLKFLTDTVSNFSTTTALAKAGSENNTFLPDSELDVWRYGFSSWVVFNGGSVSSTNSQNVSGVVRDATGEYTITFNTAYTSVDAVFVSCSRYAAGTSNKIWVDSLSTTEVSVRVKDSGGTARDPSNVMVGVIGYLS